MTLPASYSNGFAPRDGSPLYPSLWRGCVGAWAPLLGPSGLTVRDWSVYKNNATLTSMDPATDFVPSLGRYALDYDGTNDYTPTAKNAVGGASSVSCECWVNLRSLGGGFVGLFGSWAAATANRSWTLFINSNAWSFGTGNGTSQALASAGTSATTNTLTHVCGVKNAATNKLYINGDEVASTSTHTGAITVGNNAVIIGALRTDDPTPFYANCQVWQATCWNRELSKREIKLSALKMGIAYELDQRRRASVQVAASFNRRRRLLLGAS